MESEPYQTPYEPSENRLACRLRKGQPMALNHCASSNGRWITGMCEREVGGLTASSTSCAISHSAGSLARSSKRSCDWRSETMLRARSRWTSASASLVNSDCMMKALVAPGAVEVTAHHEQTCEAPFPYDFHRREVVEGFVAGGHPAVGQLAVLGKEQAQILVDAQQMADAFVLVAAGADGFTLAVASERGAVARGDAQQRGL